MWAAIKSIRFVNVRAPKPMWNYRQLATKKATTFIQGMEKTIVGANPANDDDFFKEVWMLEPNVVYKFHI